MIESEATGQKTFEEPRPAIGYGYFIAVTEPTVNDDDLHGFSINSIWYKSSVPYRLWICTNNTTGAAVWREIPLSDGIASRGIFDRYANAPTTGTTQETLYADTIPSFTLFTDGDEVRISYRGTYAGNGNDKHLLVSLDGQSVFDSGALTKNGGAWELRIEAQRSASDSLRVTSIYIDGTGQVTNYEALSSLDFSADISVLLDAINPTAIADTTARSAKAWFIPAAPVTETFYLLEGGDYLVEGGDRLTY